MAVCAAEGQALVRSEELPHSMGMYSSAGLRSLSARYQLYDQETNEFCPERAKKSVSLASLYAKPRFPMFPTGFAVVVARGTMA